MRHISATPSVGANEWLHLSWHLFPFRAGNTLGKHPGIPCNWHPLITAMTITDDLEFLRKTILNCKYSEDCQH